MPDETTLQEQFYEELCKIDGTIADISGNTDGVIRGTIIENKLKIDNPAVPLSQAIAYLSKFRNLAKDVPGHIMTVDFSRKYVRIYNSEDFLEEIKSVSSSLNGHHNRYSSNDFGATNNSNKQKEFQNPYIDYSLALFQRFNLIRTEPLKFYSESDKYNLSKIIEELIDKNDKSLKLTWSAKKEKIINNIMRDKKVSDIRKKLNIIKRYFSKEFDIKIYYAKGNFSRIDDALWNVLFGLRNLGEEKLRKFLTDKIDYCVIYSINEDDLTFDSESENKTNSKKVLFSIIPA